MNKEIKKLWVDALKSGEYEQTVGILKDEDGYCCLGVLCDIHSKVTGSGYWDELVYVVNGSRVIHTLPFEVAGWAELPGSNPDIPGTEDDTLASLNDNGSSFGDIATIIEERF